MNLFYAWFRQAQSLAVRPLHFEPCAPPSEWRLELRFSYFGHLNLSKFDPQIQSHEEVPCRQPIGPTLVRKPIGPTAHWSEKVSLVRKPLVRKSVSLVRKPIGPKKCHWSENSGNVDYHVVSKPDTFIGGKLAF